MYFLKRVQKKKNVLESNQLPDIPVNPLVKYKDYLFASALFLLNFFFLLPFLGKDYPQAAFSAPILPLLAKILEILTPLNFSQSIGMVVLFSFPLASLTWYLFFKKLSVSSLLSFLASLIFLLPWFYLPRFALFWREGDGIHALGFALTPMVAIVFLNFLRTGLPSFFLASFLGVSLISLISPFALTTLYAFLLILTFSEMLLGQARIKILRLLIIGIFAQGFSSFWYHPQFLISLVQSEQGRQTIAALWRLFPLSFFTIPVLGAFSFLLFDRKPGLQPIFFAFVSTAIFSGLVAAEGVNDYLPFNVPARFFPEFYIVLSFFLAISVNFLINLPRKGFSLRGIFPRLVFAHHASDIFLTSILTALLVWPAFSLIENDPIIPQVAVSQVLGVQTVWVGVGWGISQGLGSIVSLFTVAVGVILKIKIKS